jgi:hypothetical protein
VEHEVALIQVAHLLSQVLASAVIHLSTFLTLLIAKAFPEAQVVHEVALIQVAQKLSQAVRTLGVGVVFT